MHTADYTLSGLGLRLGLVCVRAYCLDCNNASVQTYRYDIMAKGNSNWLKQVADDFILNSYFNDIIENPAVLNSLLKDKHKWAFLKKLSHTNGVCVCVCGRVLGRREQIPGTGSCFGRKCRLLCWRFLQHILEQAGCGQWWLVLQLTLVRAVNKRQTVKNNLETRRMQLTVWTGVLVKPDVMQFDASWNKRQIGSIDLQTTWNCSL